MLDDDHDPCRAGGLACRGRHRRRRGGSFHPRRGREPRPARPRTPSDGILPTLDRHALVDLAVRASLRGGDVVREGAEHRSSGIAERAREKGAGDYVTSVDLGSERVIREALAAGAPDIPTWGEEEGGSDADRYWLVDPLDGTTNFVHRFPAVGVSIALIEDGVPVVGVVHAPFLATTWCGARGIGAWRGQERLHISDRPPERAIVATGFPFRRKQNLPRYLAAMTQALDRFEDLRRPGAASLDLAWVAEGVFDGFFELGLGAWDVAAGALLIEEAGGDVSDWAGGPAFLLGDIVAGSPVVHAALLAITTTTHAAPL